MSKSVDTYEEEFIEIPNFPNYLVSVSTHKVYRKVEDNLYFMMDGYNDVYHIHNDSLRITISNYTLNNIINDCIKNNVTIKYTVKIIKRRNTSDEQ